MKRILLFIVLIYYVPVFSQNTAACDYVFIPPPNNSGSTSLTRPNQYIHAIDINIDNNTTVNFYSAEFYIMRITTANPEPVNQAKIYLYEDQNGSPGNLISNYDVTPTSVIFLGGNPNSVAHYKVTIPLPFNSVNSSIGGKIWFGYQLKTASNQNIYQELFPNTDAVGVRIFKDNVWKLATEPFVNETRVVITKNCTVSALITNDITDNTESEKLVIYPNPTKGIIFFNKHLDIKNIELYDVNGRKLGIEIFDNKIDLAALPKGLYIIKYMLSDGTVSYKKIIKE